MTDSKNAVGRIKSDLGHLTHDEIRSLIEELFLRLLPMNATPPALEHIVDLSPLDSPIESQKDPKTGELRIRYPVGVGLMGSHRWREVVVTSDAQRELILILEDSISTDDSLGRNQPKSKSYQ